MVTVVCLCCMYMFLTIVIIPFYLQDVKSGRKPEAQGREELIQAGDQGRGQGIVERRRLEQ